MLADRKLKFFLVAQQKPKKAGNIEGDATFTTEIERLINWWNNWRLHKSKKPWIWCQFINKCENDYFNSNGCSF